DLVVGPARSSFVAGVGSTTPQTETLSIRNASGGQLSWAVSEHASWLTLSQTGGAGDANLIMTADPAGLATGSYTATVTITATSRGTGLGTRTVDVYLDIFPNGTQN